MKRCSSLLVWFFCFWFRILVLLVRRLIGLSLSFIYIVCFYLIYNNNKYTRSIKEQEAFREIMILTKMNHPNVISMYEYFESEKYISIILNYCEGTPLLTELEKYKKDYTTKRISKILWQLCKAVRHLKAKDIIWCNFSHHNIIYDGSDIVICGFSRSRVKVKRDLKQAKSILGLRGNINFYYLINWNTDLLYLVN